MWEITWKENSQFQTNGWTYNGGAHDQRDVESPVAPNITKAVKKLPQFSKILEKSYHSRLMAFIDSNQVLYKSQYGFRKQMSTSLAIIELVE